MVDAKGRADDRERRVGESSSLQRLMLRKPRRGSAAYYATGTLRQGQITSAWDGAAMKPVVIYYSFTGNNRQLALELQRRLGCDVIEVSEAHGRTRFTILLDLLFRRAPALKWHPRDLRQYGAAVLVAPIWAGRVATPLAAFIAQQKDALPPFVFISLCSGVPAQADKIAAQLLAITGRKPQAVRQLNLNDRLPAQQRNRVRYTNAYRASAQDMRGFESEIDGFVRALQAA